ncbi:MAG: YCF48-related protein [Blastocatellia bacterium]
MTKSPRLFVYLVLIVAVWVGGAFAQAQEAQPNPLSVQVASYLRASDAQAAVNRLKAKKLDAYWVKAEIQGMGTRYRVRIGRYSVEDEATIGAAQACKTRAVANYLIADGDNVPVGVPAKTCKSAIEFAARMESKSDKAGQLAANPPTAVTNNPKATPAATPKVAEKARPKVVPANESANAVTPAPVASTKPAAPPRVTDKPLAPTPAPDATPKVNPTTVVAATPKANPKANAANFVPAATPREIVSNAYKYATSKAGASAAAQPATAKPLAANEPALAAAGVDSLLARSVSAPGAANEVAIANPKWKVSQGNIASDKNLRAVHFVNTKTGWAAGDEGTIYQTADGGKQWTPVRSASLPGAVVDVNRIYFINENRGWMLAESHDKEQGRTVLLSTEDGGKIWQHFEMPNVTSFFFVDGKTGWAVGKNSTMLRTTDGGMKWKSVENLTRLVGLPVESASSTFGFSDVYFLKNGEIGWAVGNFYGMGTSNIGGLFMTMNGGESWQRIPIAVQRKTNSTRFTKGKLHSVRFTDVSNGVITGEMEDGEDHFFFTLKTRNGGETWEQARVASSGLHSTQFVDSSRGWTAATARRGGTANAKIYDTVLLRTDNGGRSWVTDFIAKGKQIRSVYFLSPTRGWAVGDQGMILRYEAQ